VTELTRWFLLAVLGVAAWLPGAAKAATPVDTQGATQCSFGAFATDPNPKGTYVRAAPRADAPVIGHLPPLYHLSPDDDTGVELQVMGAKDGWLLIGKGKYENTLDNGFDGPGWIPGNIASLSIGDERLFAAPNADAPVVVWLMDMARGWGASSFEVTQILSCQGQFAEITVQPPDKNLKPRSGWVTGTCTAQLSTCDYAYPDGVKRPEDYRYPEN
jgi:hypothetical protein